MAHIISKAQRERRQFLKQCAAISVLGSGAGAMNGKLGLMGSALAASSDYAGLSDYKALVCVFLYGGSDSFSMVVPTDEANFNSYAASRGGLTLNSDTLLKSTPDTGIGFNPQLSDLFNLYDAGRLAVVSNVGNLIAPVNKGQYANESSLIPNDLFAHNHQQEQWLKGLSSSPASIVGSGWGGRMADLLQHANPGSGLPPSFSLAGSNYWLPGNQVQPIGLNPVSGLSPLAYLDGLTGLQGNAARESTLDQMLGAASNHPLKQQASSSFSRAKDAAGQLVSTLAANTTFNTSYDDSSRLATQLRMVARLIAGNQQLGMRRQIFFVGAGGWDTHDNQTPRLEALMTDLNRSLADFQATLDELAADDRNIMSADSVTTFTASDFGRTLTINGDGSDHGWGGHYMVMGGAVNGGQLYGQLPDYAVGSADDVSDKGRVIPKLSINQYGATLAKWMGVTDGDLAGLFPDLANFDSDWQSNVNFLSV